MTTVPVAGSHVKRYRDAASCAAAARNYRWLASLGVIGVPRLLAAESRQLVFERVEGRHARPADLAALAGHLGDIHGAAYATELRHAWMGGPHRTRCGHLIPGFLDRRLAAVFRELRSGRAAGAAFTEAQAEDLLSRSLHSPVAFYKDANPRNFLITPQGPVAVDFDDLTLAPFGYDLAKLVATMAMTYGAIPARPIRVAVDAYNSAAARHLAGTGVVTCAQVMAWAEIHHILTSRDLGRGGYRHSWASVRPASPWAEGCM